MIVDKGQKSRAVGAQTESDARCHAHTHGPSDARARIGAETKNLSWIPRSGGSN
jgi:hypothetical protein